MECPNCKSNKLIKLGKYGKQEKQRYGCIDCKDNGREPWTFYEQPTNNREEFYCPNEDCGSNNVIRKGIVNGRQRYACLTCKDNGREPWTFYGPKQYKTMPEEILDDDFFKQTPEEIEEFLQMRAGMNGEDIEKNRMLIQIAKEKLKVEQEEREKQAEQPKVDKPIIEQLKEIELAKEHYYSTKGKKEKPVKKENEDVCPECGSELYIKNKKAICKECGEEYEWRD